MAPAWAPTAGAWSPPSPDSTAPSDSASTGNAEPTSTKPSSSSPPASSPCDRSTHCVSCCKAPGQPVRVPFWSCRLKRWKRHHNTTHAEILPASSPQSPFKSWRLLSGAPLRHQPHHRPVKAALVWPVGGPAHSGITDGKVHHCEGPQAECAESRRMDGRPRRGHPHLPVHHLQSGARPTSPAETAHAARWVVSDSRPQPGSSADASRVTLGCASSSTGPTATSALGFLGAHRVRGPDRAVASPRTRSLARSTPSVLRLCRT